MSINQYRNRQREQSIVVADLVDHYIQTELSDGADWHSHATRIVYSQFLKRWIRPHWGCVGIRDVRTVAVERWLKQLCRVDGGRLAVNNRRNRRNRNTRRNVLSNCYQNMASGFGAESWGIGPFTFTEFTEENRARRGRQRGLTVVSTRLADGSRC